MVGSIHASIVFVKHIPNNNNNNGIIISCNASVNNNKKVDDLIHHMRKNNADGQYEKALGYLRRLKDPKLSDLVQFMGIDKGSNYALLKNEINREDKNNTAAKILEDARTANNKEQLKTLLDLKAKDAAIRGELFVDELMASIAEDYKQEEEGEEDDD